MSRSGLSIVGQPSSELVSAFTAVAGLHRAFDNHPTTIKGKSLKHCIFSAQTAALTFREMGLEAEAVVCALLCITLNDKAERVVHRVGSFDGAPLLSTDGVPVPGWNGHMVVLVEDYLFDPTFWQIDKTRELPVMLALPAIRQPVENLTAFTRMKAEIGGKFSDLMWIDTPANTNSDIQLPAAEVAGFEAMRRDVVRSLTANAPDIPENGRVACL